MRRRILVIGVLAVVSAGVVAAVIAPEVARHSSGKPSLRRGTVSLVGDSLNVGVEPYLRADLGGWQIDTDDVVGRATTTGVEHVSDQGTALGSYVVISLGTNDPVTGADAFRAEVAAVLGVASSRRCVVWATIHRNGDAYEPFNEVLLDASATNRNLRLVEWAAMIRDHPEWLAADGIHGTPDGYRARATAVLDAMRTCPGRA